MTEATLDAVFSALASPVRRTMIVQLAAGPAHVSELGAPHDISLPAISKHLDVLERAGLVDRRADGRFRHCHLHPQPMRDAMHWMREQAQFWEESLDRLDRYLDQADGGNKQ